MKKLLGLLLLCVIAFVVVYRQRLFLRDPLATVTRDGVKQAGVMTMINYSNDVLLLDGSTVASPRVYLVQNWNKVAATPTVALKCEYGVVCMTDNDQASATSITPGRGHAEPATMSNRQVEFVDENGAKVEVTLR